jgi:phosphoglycolate phosphatase-like HAD superfamily hydrolase
LSVHLRALGADGAVMIGDAMDDAKAAAAVRIACVLYDGGSHHRAELESAGVPVTSSLVEAAQIALAS